MNRTSRTGPSADRKDGTRSRPPLAVAKATCGLTAGLVPPIAGCAWQPPQPSRFIVGPRPSSTSSASLKSSRPCSKNLCSLAVRPAIASPAPAGPKRTPGSRALVENEEVVCEEVSLWKRNAAATADASAKGAAYLVFISVSHAPLLPEDEDCSP